ncbi:MAG: LysM peptidoglycan-binding domain-containing protein [Verrucomicrobia bacterium]|nr:LysM peptidoglycan-binding domain-containing protein [Verrucomicrobiota bacterium]MBU6445902.1 LysM peptidoglycan-binding domain-containing protein [Verrucomicrobiota bacterium]MDE3047156.1 LysM peptidoglycan-binding domain-containing protein [Verrucomicrobiota bacterium]
MNRKKPILIAVMINAALLAVLLVAAITMQDEGPQKNEIAQEEPIHLQLPKFETPVYQEIASLTLPEAPKPPEEPAVVHSLPSLEAPLASVAPPPVPVVAAPPVLPPMPTHEVVVKKGDSLEKIARANRVSVDEIIKLNHLPSSFLKIGQVLKLPTEKALPKVSESKALESNPEYYTIKVGENPWAIAQRHHMKLDELLKLNGLNEEKARKLKAGDRLRIR